MLDGIREPSTLNLVGVLATDRDDEELEGALALLETAVESATRLYHVATDGSDIEYLQLHGAAPMTIEPEGVNGSMLRVTVPLIPASTRWSTADADSGYSPDLGPDDTKFYVEVTIPTTSVGSTLTEFPVYLDLSDMPAEFWAHVQADGGDIRVTHADGTTRVPVDLVAIDTNAQSGELHFLAPSLSSSADNVFRVYYGHGSLSQPASTDTYGRNAVWADYVAVYHLDDDPGGTAPQMTDSTGNGHDGTVAGDPTTTTGQLGAALDFDLTDDRVQVGHLGIPGGSNLTIQAWANLTEWGSEDNYILFGSGNKVLLRLNTASEKLQFILNDLSGTDRALGPTVTVGSWAMHHAVYDGSNFIVYSNAVGVTTAAGGGTYAWHSNDLYNNIGRFRDSGNNIGFLGAIDEVRIRAAALTNDWIAAEYVNQSNPASFYTVGTEQAA